MIDLNKIVSDEKRRLNQIKKEDEANMAELNKIVSEEKRRLNQIKEKKENEANREVDRIAKENREQAEAKAKADALFIEKTGAYGVALFIPLLLLSANFILSGILRLFL